MRKLKGNMISYFLRSQKLTKSTKKMEKKVKKQNKMWNNNNQYIFQYNNFICVVNTSTVYKSDKC